MQSTDKTNLASNMNYNHLQMAIEIKPEDVKAISVKLKRLTDKPQRTKHILQQLVAQNNVKFALG